MRGAVFGTMAMCGVGGAAYVGVGSGPNDYVGTVNKSPEAVYAAFASAMGPEGITALPSRDGWPARLQQRVSKTAGEEVKVEFVVDNRPLVTMEVDFAAEGPSATRVAAEIDIDTAALASFADAGPGDSMAFMAMGDGIIDMAFAQTMAEMVEDVENGRPLTSMAMLSRRWGSQNGSVRSRANSAGSYRGEQVRPDASARPMVDPNAAARNHREGTMSGGDDGWGSSN